ncbi:MAG: hypothetical protein HC795_16115 [Coleofasciculaceae cyanobacterium RL_1_1]|nr:hypothetical protein [Coleofasciculaceae cyanobacterium RL_1_1]
MLEKDEPDRKIYLAIPEQTYTTLFARPAVKGWIQNERVNLLVSNPTPKSCNG